MKYNTIALFGICAISAATLLENTPRLNAASAGRIFALSLDQLDQRIVLEPRETITLQITDTLPTNEVVTLSAPNGGNFNRASGRPVQKAVADLQNVQFTAGASTGLYVLEIKHGKETRMVEFWVGPQPPVGKAGPERAFAHD